MVGGRKVYLSLHRSEGYGLTIREAMLHNLYIVATGWSGNMDFMEGERVFPAPYTLVPVSKADGVFGDVVNPRWAEANIEATVLILRELKEKMKEQRQNSQAVNQAVTV